MTATDQRAATPSARVVLLVSAGLFINYIDRGNLATAAPLMQDELRLNAGQLGVLLSAFYYGYVLAMAPAGWLAERYGAHKVLAAGVALWSAATLSVGFVSGFAALFGLRLLLGLGESVAFPCASKLLTQAVEPQRLSFANGAMSCGYLLGPAVGTLLGGLLMNAFGWRPIFVLLGVLSLAWLWPWSRVVVNRPQMDAAPSVAQPSLGQILRRRALWSAAVGLFSANYAFYFILAWLPFYLVKARGFSVDSMAWTASWAYLLNAVFALLTGWLMDRALKAGRSMNLMHKGVMALNHVLVIACMAAMVLLPATGLIAALFVYEIMAGVASPGLFAIPQIMAGPRASARWVGVHNCVGASAGILAPAITGLLVERSGEFYSAFMLAAGVSVIGLIAWTVALPPIAPIRWEDAGRGDTPAAGSAAVLQERGP
jgi:MFS family permease